MMRPAVKFRPSCSSFVEGSSNFLLFFFCSEDHRFLFPQDLNDEGFHQKYSNIFANPPKNKSKCPLRMYIDTHSQNNLLHCWPLKEDFLDAIVSKLLLQHLTVSLHLAPGACILRAQCLETTCLTLFPPSNCKSLGSKDYLLSFLFFLSVCSKYTMPGS